MRSRSSVRLSNALFNTDRIDTALGMSSGLFIVIATIASSGNVIDTVAMSGGSFTGGTLTSALTLKAGAVGAGAAQGLAQAPNQTLPFSSVSQQATQ